MANLAPWDDGFDNDNDDAYEAFWKTQKAEDFYFAVYEKGSDHDMTEGAGSTVVITPKAYLDKEGYWWDGGMNLSHIYLAFAIE